MAIRQTITFRFLAVSLKLALDNAKLSVHRFCRHPFWSLLVLFFAVISKPAFAADAVAYPPELQRVLQSALEKKGPHYKPRTEHLLKNGRPRFTNRLILEDSPYLVQHAHNPVDWFPWGKEAFQKARRENKPVFLSIGYSTCHWCHVMERESFDNTDVADILNKHYVAIKVDRERRPDIDSTYMAAVMILNGRGGWPMSSFLTQDGKTFFGGTYIPRDQFIQLLQDISTAWRERHEELEAQAGRITAVVAEINAARGKAGKVNNKTIQKAVDAILGRYDDLEGGFSEAPKFPNEPSLLLLLDAALRSDDKRVLAPLVHSLGSMAQGGLYDQVGGGFHRYATDPGWRVPHFEKMLYNQAHLARAYLLVFRLTGDPLYSRIVRQTLDYVLREMRSGKGGFYSATDADSEGSEGRFFIWTKEQFKRVLDKNDAALATDLFGVSEAGNFEGSNILYLPVALDEYARQKDQPLDDLLGRIDTIRERLHQAREQREHPFLDQKIITAWNGMMITTLTMAGDLLNDVRYLKAAELAANFLWTENRRGDGRLWRSSLNATASVEASQEDYAYFAEALLELYDATGEQRWLNRAEDIADEMLKHYWDEQNGGFFMATQASDVPIMVRTKDGFDSTSPSGNAVALRVLARLARRTGNVNYEDKAHATIAAFSEQIVAGPAAYSYMLLGVGDLMYGETGGRQYAKQGAVLVTATVFERGDIQELSVEFKIKPGWHINANKPLQKDLIPTAMSLAGDAHGWKMAPVIYPKPKITKLGFQKQHLALYDGDFQLRTKIVRNDEKAVILPLDITLQACNDQSCLPPEILKLRLSRAVFH